MKIALIGNAGSGKSTLAYVLQRMFDLPLYHLDQYYWKPGWQRPEDQEFEQKHHAVCGQDRWIIEGIASRLFSYRAQQADVIIFLDISRWRCLYRILKRAIMFYGKESASSPKGCPERGPSWEFLKFIWHFDRDRKPAIEKILQHYQDTKQVFVIRTNHELEAMLQQLVAQKK